MISGKELRSSDTPKTCSLQYLGSSFPGEKEEYDEFLSSKGVKILKAGRNYRIISVEEGYFKVRFIYD